MRNIGALTRPSYPIRLRYCCAVLMSMVVAIVCIPAFGDTPATGRWQPLPELWDEFSSEVLDATRWETRNPHYPGKKPALYMSRNVTVKGGMLNLWAKSETVPNAPVGYHSYTTAYVTSKQAVLYGYFEVRARPMNARVNNGFWFYRWTETGTYEIDVFEIGGSAPKHENVVHTNTHVFKGRPEMENDSNRISDPNSWSAGPSRLADGFHVYGFEWDEQELRFYFDGQLIRSKANTVWHVPMHLRFSTETHPDWFGLPTPGELPAAFLIDYVRAWQRVPGTEKRP